MISATILLSAQKAADPVPTWIPVLAAVTSAGIATILVNLVKGFSGVPHSGVTRWSSASPAT